MSIKTVSFEGNRLRIIDQRALPHKRRIIKCKSLDEVYDCIKTLAVRGAPAIGVFAAYGVYVAASDIRTDKKSIFFNKLKRSCDYLKRSRPTAVNLFWAIDRMESAALRNNGKSVSEIKRLLLKEARKIHREDEYMCRAIGLNGAKLIKTGDTILTHCNAGSLATAGEGTALAVIYEAKRKGKRIKVFADETRPLLQGARLTAWELMRNGIDTTLICDNMAATIMRQGMIDKIVVGADRIAANGDAANKIGTYGLAVLAGEHKIPFYVAAPSSTFDFTLKSGRAIPIEERKPDEVRSFSGRYSAPKNIKVYNPAFDVTPGRLITSIITEKGIFKKPYKKTLSRLRQR
jgi:methylthioribose-1-phosphate isomerase